MSKNFVLNSVSLTFALSGVLLFSTVSVSADAGATAKQAGVVLAQKVKPVSNSSKVAEAKNVNKQSSQSVTTSKDNKQRTTYTYALRKTPSKSTVANKYALQNKKVRIAKANSKKKNAAYFKGHAKKAKSLNRKKSLKNTAKKVSKKSTNTNGSQTPVNANTGETTTNNNTTTTNTVPATSNDANTGSSSTPSTSTGTTESNQTSSNNTTSFNPQSTKISTGSNAVNGQQTQQSQQATQEAKDAQLIMKNARMHRGVVQYHDKSNGWFHTVVISKVTKRCLQCFSYQ
ncbi:MAG: hypothetical protein LKJ26_06295 [Lentilactobacillus buchneri]|jgi:hypothetical protein|nr:hypothetical protein [Lentilactobacillus buchneri]MCI2019079.1 hypothetical protein [Lentilactobacillus buchneri]